MEEVHVTTEAETAVMPSQAQKLQGARNCKGPRRLLPWSIWRGYGPAHT